MSRTAHKQSGFTILELMIATTIFSGIVLLATTVFIWVNRYYTKAVTRSNTQFTANAIVDELARGLQLDQVTSADISLPPTPKTINGHPVNQYTICVGDKRYTYYLNYQLNGNVTDYSGKYALQRDDFGGDLSCAIAPTDGGTGEVSGTNVKELLGQNMTLDNLQITPDTVNNMYQININLLNGDNNPDPDAYDFSGPQGTRTCKDGNSSEYCAGISLSETVYNRATGR